MMKMRYNNCCMMVTTIATIEHTVAEELLLLVNDVAIALLY